MKNLTTTTKYQRFIDACRQEGLDNDSLLIDIEEVVFDVMANEGFGYGYGCVADQDEMDAAWERAVLIARYIDGLL